MAETKGQSDGLLSSLGNAVKESEATKRVLREAQNYLEARTYGFIKSLEDKLGSVAEKATERAEGGGAKGESAKKRADKLAKGTNPIKAVGSLVEGGKEKVKSLTGSGGGESSSVKMTNIIEDIDVGLPISVVYNQWTQFEEFSSFMKGVNSVDRKDEEVESTWRMKVFLSRRTHNATTTEQIPDRKIAWTSDSEKGSTKGVVTFHPLADDLTRILVVVEYSPEGFFEKTANLWRAPGRRLRLDLKHFRRFIMMQGEETGAWRGEIRDSEVTRSGNDESSGDAQSREPAEKEQ